MIPWQENVKKVMQAMIASQEDMKPEDGPTMAIMPLEMIAGLRKESEPETLEWLNNNPKCEYQGGGMWLVRL